MTAAIPDPTAALELAHLNRETLLALITAVPKTSESASAVPAERAQAIARAAGRKAALVSAAMSLPPGPLGWLTIPVEVAAVWRVQAQMIADIGGAYGRTAALSPSAMLNCLFREAATQVARELGVRFGQRVLCHGTSLRVFGALACRVGVGAGTRALGRGLTRALPIFGAAAAAYCARLDTRAVAAAAIALLESESQV